MPVTIQLPSHPASNTGATQPPQDPHGSQTTIQPKSPTPTIAWHVHITLVNPNSSPKFHAAATGFVYNALDAYNARGHLTIQPRDIWSAILSQLNIWINAAGEARGRFAPYRGRKFVPLEEQEYDDSRKGIPVLVRETEKHMRKADPELRKWISPDFTEEDLKDSLVTSILMMGIVPLPFSYLVGRECGFTSVTLSGEPVDWKVLYERVDKLETFGVEPARFGRLLKPVIARFIESFNDPLGDKTVDFWGQMISTEPPGSGCGGPIEYAGWISAFCFWSEEENLNNNHILRGSRGFMLDDVIYHTVDCSNIPQGYAIMPVMVHPNRTKSDKINDSADETEIEEPDPDQQSMALSE